MKKIWAVLFLGCFVLVGSIAQAKSSSVSGNQPRITDEFTFQGIIDVKAINMTNAAFTETSDWTFYPVYRAIISKGFARQNFMLLADFEKPGYANITYPVIKINEMYAKFQESNFYVKLGRQQFGDEQDLLLGFQNDAVALGFSLSSFDVMVFYAKTALATPWATGGVIDSLVGIVPTFDIGSTMKLDAKVLVGTEPITIISGATPEDSMNTLIHAGVRYDVTLPVGAGSAFDVAAQVGGQMGLAKTAMNNNIDATSIAAKLDAMYSLNDADVDLNIGGHFIFTGGDPDPAVNTQAGFASLNALPGAGPGLFSEIENGAGLYSYIDSHLVSDIIHNLESIMAAGLTVEIEVNQFVPGFGVWFFSDNDKDGKALGMELDQSLIYRVSSTVSFYEQFAYFLPNREGLEQRGLWPVNPPAPLPAIPDPEAAIKLLVGSSISF